MSSTQRGRLVINVVDRCDGADRHGKEDAQNNGAQPDRSGRVSRTTGSGKSVGERSVRFFDRLFFTGGPIPSVLPVSTRSTDRIVSLPIRPGNAIPKALSEDRAGKPC